MELKIDLEWADEGIVPEKVYPDTGFIFIRMPEAMLEMVAPNSGERVLDVGCGRAVDALNIARRGGTAIGLEPSAKMIDGAKDHLNKNRDGEVALVRGIGEALPFKKHSLDKIMCKGALDHFADQRKTMAEMSQALKPGGEAIIAIANFDSLSCRLGKLWYFVAKRFSRQQRDKRHPWQPPPDHTFKYDYSTLQDMASRDFKVVQLRGLSLLWTAPYWGKALAMLPRWGSAAILTLLDRIARLLPWLSDVIIVKLTPRGD